MEDFPQPPQKDIPAYETMRKQADRDRHLRMVHARNRLAFIMAMAHGAVELSLRRETRGIRRVVRDDLNRRYGFRASGAFNASM